MVIHEVFDYYFTLDKTLHLDKEKFFILQQYLEGLLR
jgi:hypothetical protein